MLTPKETGGVGSTQIFPFPIAHSALNVGNSYLMRSGDTAGSVYKGTFHFKMKSQGESGGLYGCYWDTTSRFHVWLSVTGALTVYFINGGTVAMNLSTGNVFVDPTGHYNVTIAIDTTQAVEADRVKVWKDDKLLSLSGTWPVLNDNLGMFNTWTKFLGSNASSPFAGNLSDFYVVDGTAYDYSTWIEPSDLVTGLWINKATPTLAYGQNGGHYLYDDAGDMGNDSSGNGRHCTVVGTILQSADTQSNNYCVLNPLAISDYRAGYPGPVVSAGNLKADWSTAASAGRQLSTLRLPTSGKFYWEGTVLSSTWSFIGLCAAGGRYVNDVGAVATSVFAYANGVDISQLGLTALAPNDVVGCCYDGDAQTIQFKVNNVDRGTAVDLSTITVPLYPACGDEENAATTSQLMNFGASGFTYTPPEGFVAINAQNIYAAAPPTIMRSAEVVELVTRIGTSAATTVTGLLFPPDFTAIKCRDAAYNHNVFDIVRGAAKPIHYNLPALQYDAPTMLTAFTSDRYSLGDHGVVNELNKNFIDTVMKAGVEQGLQIVQFTGNGITGRTISHNLGKVPTFIFVKAIANGTSTTEYAKVYHKDLGTNTILLTPSVVQVGNYWPSVTATTIDVGSIANADGWDYIAYIFTDSDIFRAFSYVGNLSDDGPFANLGGRPLAVPFLKDTANTTPWYGFDARREPVNPIDTYAWVSLGEPDAAGHIANFTSQGIKIPNASGGWNTSGALHIGLAILESTIINNAV